MTFKNASDTSPTGREMTPMAPMIWLKMMLIMIIVVHKATMSKIASYTHTHTHTDTLANIHAHQDKLIQASFIDSVHVHQAILDCSCHSI